MLLAGLKSDASQKPFGRAHTVIAVVCATLLHTLADVVMQECPERGHAYLLHDNARPHVSKVIRNKIQEQGWEVLSHPPYSSSMTPSDYDLLKALM